MLVTFRAVFRAGHRFEQQPRPYWHGWSVYTSANNIQNRVVKRTGLLMNQNHQKQKLTK